MSFERSYPAIAFTVSFLIWAVAALGVMWPLGLPRLVDRLPFILVVPGLALGYSLMILPKAFPGFFEWLLGHSIYALRFETDWQWINRWEMWVARVFRWLLILGAIWGIVNLSRRKAIILNGLAVIAAVTLLYFETRMGL